MSNLGSSSISPGTVISVSFQGCVNPSTTQPVSFSITTYYGDTYPVDKYSVLSYTASPDTITVASVKSSSIVNGQSALYTLNYTVKNTLPINAIIVIGLPIGLNLSTGATCTLSINGSSYNLLTATVVSSVGPYYNTGLNLTLPSSAPSGTVLSFIISSIGNPITTQTSGSFSIFSYDSGNNIVESITATLTVTMITPSTFNSMAVTSQSGVNGAMANFSLVFTPLTVQPSGTVMLITVPAGINVLTTSLACYNGSNSLDCSYSAQTLRITLSS